MTSRSWGRSSSCSGGTPVRGGRGSSGGGGQCGKTGNHGNFMVILWYSCYCYHDTIIVWYSW